MSLSLVTLQIDILFNNATVNLLGYAILPHACSSGSASVNYYLANPAAVGPTFSLVSDPTKTFTVVTADLYVFGRDDLYTFGRRSLQRNVNPRSKTFFSETHHSDRQLQYAPSECEVTPSEVLIWISGHPTGFGTANYILAIDFGLPEPYLRDANFNGSTSVINLDTIPKPYSSLYYGFEWTMTNFIIYNSVTPTSSSVWHVNSDEPLIFGDSCNDLYNETNYIAFAAEDPVIASFDVPGPSSFNVNACIDDDDCNVPDATLVCKTTGYCGRCSMAEDCDDVAKGCVKTQSPPAQPSVDNLGTYPVLRECGACQDDSDCRAYQICIVANSTCVNRLVPIPVTM